RGARSRVRVPTRRLPTLQQNIQKRSPAQTLNPKANSFARGPGMLCGAEARFPAVRPILAGRKNLLQVLKPSSLRGLMSGLKPRPPKEKAGRPLVVLVSVACIVLAGCGSRRPVVGHQPAPTQPVDTPAATEEAAKRSTDVPENPPPAATATPTRRPK